MKAEASPAGVAPPSTPAGSLSCEGAPSGRRWLHSSPGGLDAGRGSWDPLPGGKEYRLAKLGSTAPHVSPLALLVALSFLAALLFAGPAHGLASGSPANSPPPKSLQALKALERLEPTALRRWPDTFGGLWLERGKVFVAFTTGGKQGVKRLGSRFPTPEKLRPIKVDDSLAALRALETQMVADRGTNPVMFTDPASGRLVQRPYQLEIDVKRNIVVVTVEQAVTPSLAAGFAQRYGQDVVVEQGLLAQPTPCAFEVFCAPDLRAGLFIGGSAMNWYCTSGFTAFAGATQYILSAAHCGNDPVPGQGAPPDPGGSRIHGGSTYGVVALEQLSGQLDAEAHVIQDFNLFNALHPWIYISEANKQGVVGKVGTYDGTPIGLKVCKFGANSFKSCGKVLSKTVSPYYVPNGMDFINTSVCSAPGDSGGPLYHSYIKYPDSKIAQIPNRAGGDRRYRAKGKPGSKLFPTRHQAIGIASGGLELTCIPPDPNDTSVYGHVEFIQEAFGIAIRTGP